MWQYALGLFLGFLVFDALAEIEGQAALIAFP